MAAGGDVGGGEEPHCAANCCRVRERWWLVAGRRKLCMLDFEPRLGIVPPMPSFSPVVPLLTSLFGCTGWSGAGPSIGAADPKENAKDVESIAMLDLGLPCWDNGRMESRLIHESLDDNGSPPTSAMTRSLMEIEFGVLLAAFGGVD